VENKTNGQASRDTCHNDGKGICNSQHVQRGNSISPGVPCPENVLVAVMSNGSYLLVAYPQAGPTALVIHDDAGPLRQALTAAFGGPTDETASGNGKRTGAVLPGHEALYTKQAQP
jgi:hypothetical protein